MRDKHRLVRLVIITILILSSMTCAFAYEEPSGNLQKSYTTTQWDGTIVNEWKEEGNKNDKLRTEDYLNGNACSYLMKNNKIIFSSYLDRENNRIIDTDYLTNEVTIKHIDSAQTLNEKNVYTDNSRAGYSYTRVGNIGYILKKTIEGETTTINATLNVERAIYTGTTIKDIHGTYKNKVSFISTVAALLAMPVAAVTPVVGTILGVLGISGSAVNFLIPTYMLEANYTTITWHGVGFPADRVLQGTRYVFLLPDGRSEVQQDNTYYASNSISAKNTSFALKLGRLYYPGFTSYTVKWS